ncbi:hypothetical protein [Roseomonas sp. 18066]|uniref:hypothetical protein n=1 Tax=Roseomonas sp. 18066 TaxID=2681412 RepID=UPI001357664A|nr:hypothetical protein [Roseomonas sp. 18066]
MRALALAFSASLLAGAALAQGAPRQDGNTLGPVTTQPAAPGQGNGSDAGGSNPGGYGPAGGPRGDGNRVDSEFSEYRLDAQGRGPLLPPAGSLAPGQRAPSQPPQTIPPHPWLPGRG